MKRFGVMLDMSRNSVMRIDELKKYIKILKSFGYNMIQLYTEDTYEVDGEPYFGYMRGGYSKAELKEIVSFCKDEQFEIIPCIQTLAHLNQIFRWGDYGDINDISNILLVGEERTYEFIENMIRNVKEVFSGELINIGMDEAFLLGYGKYKEKHGERSRYDILIEHLKRVLSIVEKYELKPIMWSDMFFHLATEKDDMQVPIVPQEAIDAAPEGVGLVCWEYYKHDKVYYDRILKAHKRFKNEIWFAGGAWSWTGFIPGNKKTIETMLPAMESLKEFNIENIFITMWGDGGGECSFYSLLPSLFLLRKYYDGERNFDLIKKEFSDITGEDFDALNSIDDANYVGINDTCLGNVTRHALYSDPFLSHLDSLVDKDGSRYYSELSKKYSKYAKESVSFGYLFDAVATLCEALSVKYTLGCKTRKAYYSKSKESLKDVLKDYKLCEELIEKHYNSFRRFWYKENNPTGFDVQDIRFGGILQRLRSCARAIQDYIDGKIEKIEELEEKVLPYTGGGRHLDNKIPCLSWGQSVSLNSL